MEIFLNDDAAKVRLNEEWFGEQIRNRPIVDEHGDTLLMTIIFIGIPEEFMRKGF